MRSNWKDRERRESEESRILKGGEKKEKEKELKVKVSEVKWSEEREEVVNKTKQRGQWLQ